MAQITIDIPDDLAQKLGPYQSQFAELFTRLITTTLIRQPITDPSVVGVLDHCDTYQEILDFLISQPTSAQIMAFNVSESSQNRLQMLLEKNRTATLTPGEIAELDLYQQLDTLIGFLKIRAYTALKTAPQN